MTGTDRSSQTWKRYGLVFLNWLYATLPIFPEFLSVHSKALGIIQAWHLVSRNGTKGDYVEFGVYQGDAFKLSLRAARNCFKTSPRGAFEGRFFAFDSFQGLPKVRSLENKSSVFAKGEYACSLEQFKKNISLAVKNSEVIITEGWFSDTLTCETRDKYSLSHIAVANIDCDLYESTVPCLEFITPLVRDGTILMFDDWFLMNASLKQGEALAAEEWLRRNPSIKLIPFVKYGVGGMMFIVNLQDSSSPFCIGG
ncbi:MAG: 8-demethyl-8-(2,3-dimethoxy-alpha-L-rhamnosyl)-tetracenomycin-C 4'-O-methyltransferase [Nitrosomonadaceae bacterium]|nr:8-demethyl-8-(2,3-dimethoxy-alpha-L-rhamnosyl)-tetracenomycin-C 4'-O-methyltransferase [Nitrosomonadaceae bacterium]